MPDDGILKISGAQEPAPDKYTSIAFVKLIGGLQTQRSPLQSLDTRYNSKYLGGKPDALIAGLNSEISNKLTLQRRPGLAAYGVSNIPPPTDFFDWQLATTGDIVLVVDTNQPYGDNNVGPNGGILNYSPTHSGVYVNKAALSGQTNFIDIVNTLYLGDGIDRYKIVGPNLLTWSNTFGMGSGTSFSIQSPWVDANVFALTGGQADPLGGTSATQLIWGTTGAAAFLEQDVVPNYTPIASNTFTFSLWMKETGGAETVKLQISDEFTSLVDTSFVLTPNWVKYQVTANMNSNSNVIKVRLHNPTTTNTMVIYGAQLEVGGPATTTQITTTKPQGVYLWGILAPTVAPIAVPTAVIGNQWQPNTFYNIGQTITDSNGNLETVTTAGTSGSAQPTWSQVIGDTTPDGVQNVIKQTNFNFASASTVAVTMTANVTVSSTLLAFIEADVPNSVFTLTISDNQGNLWTNVASATAGDLHEQMFEVLSAAAGSTTITVTISGPSANSVWLAVAEISSLTGVDVSATNNARDYVGTIFNTGLVTTTNARDFLITFASFVNNTGFSNEIGSPPSGFQPIAAQSGILGRPGSHYTNLGVYCQALSATTVINPAWTVSAPIVANGLVGITAAIKSAVGTLIWTNGGPVGLTAAIGYSYYYSYANSYTGMPSNVSPLSGVTGAITGQEVVISGPTRTMTPSGPYTADPQSDLVTLYRNTDGGGFWYQVAQFGNGAAAQAALLAAGFPVSTSVIYTGGGTLWQYTDSTPDTVLNTEISAPIGLLNSLPPAGLVNLEYFAGRMWGSVQNLLYYNSGPDNASLINVTQNAVPSEAWAPANVIPFNSTITRSIAVGGGLLVTTTTDTWFVTGQNLLTGGFNPVKVLVGHGLRSYNAASVDGSSVYLYTSDRESLVINPNSGSVEVGFPIGDTLEDTFDPRYVYIARHVAGSRDNAVFLADGLSGWFRLNPNQQGASMSGEATPVWSPKADFTSTVMGIGANSQVVSGIGAIASIETSPGITQLLVGQRSAGVVLVRNLTTFSDNGNPYSWAATVGSILLATSGKLAETESVTTQMSNIASTATQCSVSVMLDEIGGDFETLANSVNDPPQLNPSTSILSNRFYLSQGTEPPICQSIQIELQGGPVTTKDELLALTVRGCLVGEQI